MVRNLWTDEEVKTLKDLVFRATPYAEISKILNRTISAIGYKVIKLKLETPYTNNSQYKAIYQDYNWCYQKYIIEGLSHKEMAKEANCTKRVIEKWCTEKHRLTQKYRQNIIELTDIQKDLIIGSRLGDGHIDKRETQPIFIVTHAENQKEYLFWKYEILKNLCNIYPRYIQATTKPFDDKMYACQAQYRLCTRTQNCLIPIRKMNQKELLNNLNLFSLSIWILDDAHRDYSSWELCIADILPNEEDYIINILKTKFNLNATLRKDIRYIGFDADSTRKIDEIILNNIPNNLDIVKDKIINIEKSKKQKRLYAVYNNKKTLLSDLAKILNVNYSHLWFKYNQGFRDEDLINEVLYVK